MSRTPVRSLVGAAAGALVATTLGVVGSPAQAADPDAAFCADGSQPMITQEQVEDTFDETTEVTGLTVVKGTDPVEFTGTYIASLEDALGEDADLLLFSLTGPAIDSGAPKAAGIWAGMSGSPVYTRDGRLIGAVAYSLNADNLPIAGVTPASLMKKAGTDRLASPAKVKITPQNLEAAAAGASALVGQTPQRIKANKVVSGGVRLNAFANRTLARAPGNSAAAKSLRARDFGMAPTATTIDDPLVPGGNIAVGYATGDAFTGAIGTVTAVCGTSVWAFGHPMDFAGHTALSMHNASTGLIVPDATGWVGSYKQVSKIGQQLGTITEDRWTAVRGQVGLFSGTPVTVSVRNASGALLDTYRSTAVNPAIVGALAGYLPTAAAVDLLDNWGTGQAKLNWTIGWRLPNGRTGTLANSQVYSDTGSLYDSMAGDIGSDVSAIAETDLVDAKVTSVTATVTLLSDTSVRYRLSGAQVWTGKKWASLSGRTLKAKHRYKVRPVYTKLVDLRNKGTVAGASSTIALGRFATGRGKLDYSPRNAGGGEDCFEEDGEVYCFSFEDEKGPTSFAELIAQRDVLHRNDKAVLSVENTWKARRTKGVKRQKSVFTAPGVVEGSYQATFRVRAKK